MFSHAYYRLRGSGVAVSAAVLIALVAATVRLVYLSSPRQTFDADEAVTGLMATRITHGQGYIFYAGQHYGGTVEQYLQALMMAMFHLQASSFSLRLTQVLLSSATCFVVYLVAARALRSPHRGLLAAGLYALLPWFNIEEGVSSLGFYAAGQLLTAAVCLAAYYAYAKQTRVCFAVYGFVCGFGLWTAYSTAYVIIPTVIWLVPLLRRRVSVALTSLLAVLCGAGPMLFVLVFKGILPLPVAPTVGVSLAHRVYGLWTMVLPEFLGTTYTYGQGGLPAQLQSLINCCLVAGFLFCAYRRRRAIIGLVLLRADTGPELMDVLFLVPVVTLVLYVASPQTFFTDNPRYLFTLYPVLAVAAAALWPRRVRVAAVAYGVLVTVSVVVSAAFFFRTTNGTSAALTRSMYNDTIAVLTARDERNVYADYWTAMVLDYYATGKVHVAVCSGRGRFPDEQAEVVAHPSNVYVQNNLDSTSATTEKALRKHRLSYRKTTIGHLVIFDQLSGPARPDQIGLPK